MHENLNVFISSTSTDLGECRNRVRELLQDYGINVTMQETYPTTMDSTFDEIDGKVLSADLVICLVGPYYGHPLPKVKPAGVPDELSWTQYEVWKAGIEKKRRCIGFHEPGSAPAQSDDDRRRQQDWCAELKELRKIGGTDDTFDITFRTADELFDKLRNWLDTDSKIEHFRRQRWRLVIDRFRAALADQWRKSWPNEFNGEEEWQPKYPQSPTYIVNQGFEELMQPADHLYLPHLKPAAFVVGRDTEAEATADTGHWVDVTLPDIKQRLVNKDSSNRIHQLFVISGGGVGKTKALERLAYLINSDPPTPTSPTEACDPSILACQLSASRLQSSGFKLQSHEDIIALLATELADIVEFKKRPITRVEIEKRLRIQYYEGRLVLFVHGLDHLNIGQELPRFLGCLAEGSWESCPIVMSGRPYAVQSRFIDLVDSSPEHERRIVTSGWTFCRPHEFDESQQRAYLGKLNGAKERYDLIPGDATQILSIPRVLEYVRTLTEEALRTIHSTADVYFCALPNLIRRTMNEAHLTRHIDPHVIGVNFERNVTTSVVDVQVDYVVTMLSAAAFVMTKGDGESPNFNHVEVNDHFLREVYHRVKRYRRADDDEESISFKDFEYHFKNCLAAFNAVVSNGILDFEPTSTELCDLIWTNKSVQCFLAAFWLAREARTFQWKRDGKEFRYHDPDQFAQWVWYHESQAEQDEQNAKNDEFYDINRMLSEMPDREDPLRWLQSVRFWFAPGAKLRSSEMMYRVWPYLLQSAGEPLDDWWNVPYETIYCRSSQAASSLTAASKGKAVRGSPSEERQAARDILAAFRGELQDFLELASSDPDDSRAKSAREFVDAANWMSVPDDEFQMGFPEQLHEKPSKIDACWKKMLGCLLSLVVQRVTEARQLESGALAAEMSELLNKPIWFAGAQGIRLRKQDVAWLKGVLLPLEQAAYRKAMLNSDAGAKEVQQADEDVRTAFGQALGDMKAMWWASDQTTLETPQKVARFEMHRYPVLHRWFRLFAPDHASSVQMYLDTKSRQSSVRFVHPPDDHPVIYISWFDAWAFCQWANWTCPDTGIRYRCRLPHEPEWEFAARRARSKAGPVDSGPADGGPIPFGQPYWWGRAFYEHEFSSDQEPSGDPEQISNQYAHAIGDPAATRSPVKSLPNGFGFHEILGNVWEWTASIYQEPIASLNELSHYSRHHPQRPSSVKTIELRTMRGGLWYFLDLLATCSDRFRLHSDDRDYKMSFRVIRERICGDDAKL